MIVYNVLRVYRCSSYLSPKFHTILQYRNRPMFSESEIGLCDVYKANAKWDCLDKPAELDAQRVSRKSSRALRLVDDSARFLFVSFPSNSDRSQICSFFEGTLERGIHIRDTSTP